ncbi:MAG: N-acetyltransferase family protein [Bdellovibrionales bacterium]
MNIVTFAEDGSETTQSQIREVFFLSADSRWVDRSEEERAAFYAKWTDHYFANHRDLILVARNEGGEFLGYLMACPSSDQARSFYRERIKSYELFADQFAAYPAHLHVNLHPRSRGKGIGTTLIDELVERLRPLGVSGVHLITSPNQRNVGFYLKNGFTYNLTREWQGHSLLFMGRSL